jgi:hypothetical protein
VTFVQFAASRQWDGETAGGRLRLAQHSWQADLSFDFAHFRARAYGHDGAIGGSDAVFGLICPKFVSTKALEMNTPKSFGNW